MCSKNSKSKHIPTLDMNIKAVADPSRPAVYLSLRYKTFCITKLPVGCHTFRGVLSGGGIFQ